MDDRLIERRIHCPFCAQALDVWLDLSAGDQSYVEDCRVCCRPMLLSFTVAEGEIADLRVEQSQ